MPNIDVRSALIDTKLPVALFPVRLETRFVQTPDAAQLLVRIYPDELHIDRSGPAPARARLLPDAFMALGYANQPAAAPVTPGGALFAVRGAPIQEDPTVAPDPAAVSHDPWDAGSRWLSDFSDAEQRGLAIRVPIDAATLQQGLSHLVVVGVRNGDAAQKVADLFASHQQSDGFGVVPAGTPTNNTVDAPSGWASETTAGDVPIVDDGSDGCAAELALGLPGGTIASAPHGNVRQLDGPRRMNTLLWRATWGYFLGHMMAAVDTHAPLLGADTLAWIRAHFINFVRADGPLPAVRVGRQPYGLLPVTSLDGWPAGDRTERLASLLRSLRDRLFRPAAAGLPHLTPGQPDLDRAVGDLLAQQPHAWRYKGRNLFGAQYARTLFGLMRWPPLPAASTPTLPFFPDETDPPQGEIDDGVDASDIAWGLAGRGGVPPQLPLTGDPGVLNQLFHDSEIAASALLRDVLADLGTSWRPRLGRGLFVDAVFPVQKLSAGGSYLAALTTDTKTFLSMRDEKPPTLLDRLARHAVLLEGSAAVGAFTSVDTDLFNVTPPPGAPMRINIWSTDLGEMTVSEIAGRAGDLRDVRDALSELAALPPDELERLLIGTLDLCSYRLDAWITSLAQKRLTERRQTAPSGLYVGAYGWVTNLKPQALNPPAPDEHILAPSLDHAVTAAILRAAYQTHRATGDGAMAVDLSSARVRNALWLLDGVRQGQPLGALLGYRFERGLQEPAAPDRLLGGYIAPFRQLAPLAGDLLASGVAESVAVHDVVDGFALARVFQDNRDKGTPLPFGATATVEARVRIDRVVDDFAAIVSKIDQSVESEYMLAIAKDGRLAFCWHTESGMTWGTPSFNISYSTQTVPFGRWVHLAAVRDRETVSCYIDGVGAGSAVVADAARFRASLSKLPVRIGIQQPGFRSFVGRVRDVRLWSVASTPDDIRRLAAGPLSARSAGLAACWSFGEGTGTSIGDRSPYRRAGTILGAGNPSWVQVAATEDPLWGAGSALELNGTRYVEIPHAQNLTLGAVEGLPTAEPDLTLITAQLDALGDTVDAISDLTLAESVHHVALGNPSRAGAVLDALSRGELPPPEFEVVRTPRGGVTHSHRLAALLADGGTLAGLWTQDPTRLRAVAEPLVNEWAAALIGPPGRVIYRADYLDARGAILYTSQYALNETALGLSPLDIVYGAPGKGDSGSSEIEQRLMYQRMIRPPNVAWTSIRLTLGRWPELRSDLLSVSEAVETAAALRRVLDQARPLAGRDLRASGELDVTDAAELAQRLATVTHALTIARAGLAAAGTTSTKIRAALVTASFAGISGAVPRNLGASPADLAILNGQVRAALDELDRRVTRAAAAADDMNHLSALFGGSLRIVPRLRLTPELRDGLRAAFHVGSTQPGWDDATLHPAAWDWLSRVARVRDGASRLDDLMLYDTALNSSASALRVAQLPPRDGEAWIGLPGPSASLPGGRVSLVTLTPAGSLDLDRLGGGLVVDEWTEVVPRATQTAGLAFHADAPGAAPPHAILLAVPNDARPNWDVAGLEAILLETLDLARIRMVGPHNLGPADHLLPATLLAFNADGDTVSTDLVSIG
ncbi:MAG: LamG domain-containing protein [Acidobacteriota bacterium]